MSKHGIVRVDNAMGTHIPSYLQSVLFATKSGSTYTEADVDNGTLVSFDAIKSGVPTDVYYALAATTTDAIGKVIAVEQAGLVKYTVVQCNSGVSVGVVAEPEVMPESDKDNLSDFYNKAGRKARAYRIHELDCFGFSEECLDGTLAVGDEVIASAGKLKKKTVTSGQ